MDILNSRLWYNEWVMRKKICFPASARPHLARQKLLLEELRKYFDVDIFEPTTKNDGMAVFSIMCAVEFNNYLAKNKYDCVLIRGDRFEMLPMAMVAAYRGIPIAHIEGGDLSGVIDNRVRHAITHLSDYHFCTNEESHARLISMGVPVGKVWNFGSLDVEFASLIEPKMLISEQYILVAYHPVDGENPEELEQALEGLPYKIVRVASNKDYGKEYGSENYSPEDYINLMRYASICVGNSSSLLKEASILGVPVLNIGSRQSKRLKPSNVLDVPCGKEAIRTGIEYQIKRTFASDNTYYKPATSISIASVLDKII